MKFTNPLPTMVERGEKITNLVTLESLIWHSLVLFQHHQIQ